jgi:hypothetical protein
MGLLETRAQITRNMLAKNGHGAQINPTAEAQKSIKIVYEMHTTCF